MANYDISQDLKDILENKKDQWFFDDHVKHLNDKDLPRGYILEVYIEAIDELKKILRTPKEQFEGEYFNWYDEITNWQVRFDILKKNGVWYTREERIALTEKDRAKAQRRVSNAIRSRISEKIHKRLRNGKSVTKHVKSGLGYTIKQLMDHLESKFDDKMSWGNYGSYWHIDHIKPISKFKFDSFDHPQFKKCWSLENLQPLEAIENIKKGNRYEG